MTEFSSRLRRQGHHESSEILSRERSVMSRRSKVKQSVSERRAKLEDCRKLMVFLQDCNEVCCCLLVLGNLSREQPLVKGPPSKGDKMVVPKCDLSEIKDSPIMSLEIASEI